MKRNKRKTIIVSLLLIGVLLMSMGTVWADQTGHEIKPLSVATYKGNFYAVSSTKANAEAQCTISGISPFITLKITLQSANLGTSTFKNVSGVSPNVHTVYNATSIMNQCSFAITSDKEYRIKIEITDQVNNQTKTTTKYVNLSR